jgi:hypothetical protein
MSITERLSPFEGLSSRSCFLIAGVSLLKAIAVRERKRRFRRELREAALFFTLGLVLGQFERRQSRTSSGRDDTNGASGASPSEDAEGSAPTPADPPGAAGSTTVRSADAPSPADGTPSAVDGGVDATESGSDDSGGLGRRLKRRFSSS